MNEEVNQASELQISSMISKNNNIAAETQTIPSATDAHLLLELFKRGNETLAFKTRRQNTPGEASEDAVTGT